ncbi:MAG: YcjF family protein [Gammaproteobacteria bacterium]|nr:YcjF family protein [Gammaproteobacteria bacterium]
MKNELEKKDDKLTIYEYEERYSQKENTKRATLVLNLIITVIGIFLFLCLFLIFKEAYEFNQYVGYGVALGCVLIYIFLFIVPVVKIKGMRKFEVDVSAMTAMKAKRHNEAVRRELVDKIIELYVSTDGTTGWYSSESVKSLIEAKNSKSKDNIKVALDHIYTVDIKNASKAIIKRASLKSGGYSALSQKDTTDAMLVAVINLQMIKDIIYLYGFRPSDTRLVRIFSNVLTNSLIAYGLGNVRVGNSVAKSMGDVVRNIPLLGDAISLIVDSSVQGLSNATLTAIIGHNTVRYLMKEYNLQYILDSVEITESDEEFVKICEEVKEELISEKKNKGKVKETQLVPQE